MIGPSRRGPARQACQGLCGSSGLDLLTQHPHRLPPLVRRFPAPRVGRRACSSRGNAGSPARSSSISRWRR